MEIPRALAAAINAAFYSPARSSRRARRHSAHCSASARTLAVFQYIALCRTCPPDGREFPSRR
jgi:ribosomal protein S14